MAKVVCKETLKIILKTINVDEGKRVTQQLATIFRAASRFT